MSGGLPAGSSLLCFVGGPGGEAMHGVELVMIFLLDQLESLQIIKGLVSAAG